MNDYVEIRQVLNVIRRRLWLLVLITLATAAIGYGISQQQTPLYEASTTLMVGPILQAGDLNRGDLQTSETLAQTYADMVLRQPVLQGVIDSLEFSDSWRTLKKRMRVNLVKDTQLLEIKAQADSPEQARAIADEAARQLILLSPTAEQNQKKAEARAFVNQRLATLQTRIELGQERLHTLEKALAESQSIPQIRELQSAITTLEGLITEWEGNYTQMLMYMEQDSPANSLTIIEPAQASSRPVRPRTSLNIFLASAVGFLLASALVFVLELRDNTLKMTDDIRRSLNLQALGAVTRINGKSPQHKLLLFQDPTSPAAEAYRIICSNIEFGTVDHPLQSLVVTSPGPGEGKSITVANLGIAMAQAGFRTIIVDADLRQPVQHQLFQIANAQGLVEAILSSAEDLNTRIMDTKISNLRVLPSGKVPPNPGELLRSEGMRRVLADLSQMADFILFDSPPVLGLADTSILANRTDGVVLVVEAGQTHLDDARQATLNLQQANTKWIGVILNRASLEHQKYYTSHRRALPAGSTVSTRSNRRWQWLPF